MTKSIPSSAVQHETTTPNLDAGRRAAQLEGAKDASTSTSAASVKPAKTRKKKPSSAPSSLHAKVQALPRGHTISLPAWDLLAPNFKDHLDTFLTPGCRSFELTTPRLRLRQCRPGDLANLQKIKMEPIVQRTQLYGSPSASDCRDSFLNRYIRSSMPRIEVQNAGQCRDDYIFAITLLDPSSISLQPAGQIRMSNRLTSAEGYLGNIALSLEPLNDSTPLVPRPKRPYTHPTLTQTTQVKLIGNMFYELHPQVWGLGLMSEAFGEVLRFAMEEVGCDVVMADPTTTNAASIKLCTKFGLKYLNTTTDNEFRKPQAFYKISRKEWFKRNRPCQGVVGRWEGKVLCRWCMNPHLDEPEVRCAGCPWALYCSLECRIADWTRRGGHQVECDHSSS